MWEDATLDVAEMKLRAERSRRPPRSVLYEVARVFFYGVYRLLGWQVLGEAPKDKKIVIIAAPHETNWDLTQMLGIAFYYRIPVRWMGKKSLGEGPFGWLMRWWGLLPVDRDGSTRLVDQVVTAFEDADEMALVIAPEGTRADVTAWKTGFYNIALEADVPVALGFIDYANKFGGLDGVLIPCGDYAADMERVAAFYRSRVSRFNHPLTGEPIERQSD
jgi:1-acyl-sn-glycerol-3-phosphate acyltransferase